MSDSIHDQGHPVAAGVPTLALSGGTTCAVERGPLVWTGEAIACEGDDPRNVARAKPPPSARVHLGLVAANSKPHPVRAEARGLRSAAAGRMARRRRGERRRRSAQKKSRSRASPPSCSSTSCDDHGGEGSDELRVVGGRDRGSGCSRQRRRRAAVVGGGSVVNVHNGFLFVLAPSRQYHI